MCGDSKEFYKGYYSFIYKEVMNKIVKDILCVTHDQETVRLCV